MERSKKLILMAVGLAAILIIWQVGFNKSSEPEPITENNNNEEADIPTEPIQPDAKLPDRTPASRVMMQPDNTEERNPENPGRRQRNDNINSDRRNIATNADITGFKIAIPENIETAELRVLYDEYVQINSSFGRGRGGRRTAFGGRNMGGFREMGMGFGGMDMGDSMERRGRRDDSRMNGDNNENNQ
jgi:hypothetical protein